MKVRERATMTINDLLAKLRWFANEAVCPVNENCLPGFVSGAYEGWGWARNNVRKWIDDVRFPSIPDVAICFFKDGDKWCCVNGDFVNLQESPAGFGKTFSDALDDLRKHFPHYHEAGDGADIDTCKRCGHDIRSEVHLRVNDPRLASEAAKGVGRG